MFSWGYEDVLLLVEAENTPAMALYKKMGYKEVFRDSDVKASKAVAYSGGSTALQTVKVSLHLSLLSLSLFSLSLAHLSLSSLSLPSPSPCLSHSPLTHSLPSLLSLSSLGCVLYRSTLTLSLTTSPPAPGVYHRHEKKIKTRGGADEWAFQVS